MPRAGRGSGRRGSDQRYVYCAAITPRRRRVRGLRSTRHVLEYGAAVGVGGRKGRRAREEGLVLRERLARSLQLLQRKAKLKLGVVIRWLQA